MTCGMKVTLHGVYYGDSLVFSLKLPDAAQERRRSVLNATREKQAGPPRL